MKLNKEALEQREREREEERLKDAIIELLPDALAASVPTISNISTQGGLTPHAWLSFRGPSYDPKNTYDPLFAIKVLELEGWKVIPASLVKWDNYRRHPEMGLCEQIPESKKGFGCDYKLTDVSPIAPLWIVPEAIGRTVDARFYLRAPDGKNFKLNVALRASGVVGIRAERRESKGDWNYVRNTATLNFPADWRSHQLCTVNEHTHAVVETEKGLNGAIFFTPHDEQGRWPLSTSEFLESLFPVKEKK